MIPYVLYVLVILLGLTQILDWYSTAMILDRGGVEQNPVAAKGIALLGLQEYLIVKGICVVILGAWIGSHSIYLLALLVLVYVAVIGYNFKSLP